MGPRESSLLPGFQLSKLEVYTNVPWRPQVCKKNGIFWRKCHLLDSSVGGVVDRGRIQMLFSYSKGWGFWQQRWHPIH